jgi:hypothetical protein
MMMRGVEKQGSSTRTSAMRGVFKSDARTRQEFLEAIRGRVTPLGGGRSAAGARGRSAGHVPLDPVRHAARLGRRHVLVGERQDVGVRLGPDGDARARPSAAC